MERERENEEERLNGQREAVMRAAAVHDDLSREITGLRRKLMETTLTLEARNEELMRN